MSSKKMENGRYWNSAWQLIDGCTPCSPGCDHCWAAAMAHRFNKLTKGGEYLTDENGRFGGYIYVAPERLTIPLRRKKPTVYAVWNDFFHGEIDHHFRCDAYAIMMRTDYKHTYLILTKRADFAAQYAQPFNNIWHGLTICNQQEADKKIPIFLRVPGKKFISLEPLLGPINISWQLDHPQRTAISQLDGVILGGETGPGARPMHPDWVRSIRDQCQSAGVPFFFKGWGRWVSFFENEPFDFRPTRVFNMHIDGSEAYLYDGKGVRDVASACFTAKPIRLLDGRTHDDLPWRRIPS